MALPANIVVDVDGTLYDTKPVFSRQFALRHGIKLAPHEITEWDFWKGRISLQQFLALIGEGLHSEAEILGAAPYPGVVATLARWHAAGARIHVASDRSEAVGDLTRRWLLERGIPFDTLTCAPALDKVAYARSIGAGLIIDDKPATIRGTLSAGLTSAVIIHPYNFAEAALPGVISATAWPGLRQGVEARFK